MFCKDCGAQLADAARFCPNCGSVQTAAPPAQPVTPPSEPAMPFADKVRATAKKVGSSPLFLVATICFTLVQVLGLLSLGSAGSVFEAYAGLFAEFGVDSRELLTSLESMSLVSGIIGMLPGILITVGLWITYGSCASRRKEVNTSGLTMIFVLNLIQLVLSCLALLAVMLLLIVLYASADSWNLYAADEDILQAILLFAIFILLAVFAFALLYYIKLCTTVSNVRGTLKTGVPNKRASRFVAVMCYIGGGLLIISGIGNLLSAGVTTLNGFYDDSVSYPLPSAAFLSAISSLLSAATQILFGALIFSYRSKMGALEAEDRINSFKTLSYVEPYTAPVYTPPQPAAEPVPEPEVMEEVTEPEPTAEEND